MSGNGPIPTLPWVTDELVAIAAGGDFPLLCQKASILASGKDGSFASGVPWVLNSTSVNFQSQGVAAQNVVSFSSPSGQYPGLGNYLYAVDSASGNSCTLRLLGMGLGIGQPPSPASGQTTVAFTIPTLAAQIDQATYRLKDRVSVDEQFFWTSSPWIYQGVENPYRVFRDAVVFETLADLYEANMRDPGQQGDWVAKASRYRKRADDAIGRLYVRWGPTGTSREPTTAGSMKLAR